MNCPYCDSTYLIKHGKRSTKVGPRQIYLCKECGRTFSKAPIPYMNTDPKIVLRGVSLYNQGYSLKQTSIMLEQAYRLNLPRNTIHYWTKNYRDLFTYLYIRKPRKMKRLIGVKRYGDLYFRFHRRKLRSVPEELSSLSRYIAKAGRGLPEALSTGRPISLLSAHGHIEENYLGPSAETRIATILSGEGPEEVQRALLINDAYTVCKNLPVYTRIRKKGVFYGTVPILQVKDDGVLILRYLEGLENMNIVYAHLLGCREALKKRCKLKDEKISIGAFDGDNIWIADPTET